MAAGGSVISVLKYMNRRIQADSADSTVSSTDAWQPN